MTVLVPPDLQKRIADKVDGHRYQSPADVVAHALRALEAHESRVESLRGLVAEGIADVEAGRLGPSTADEFLALMRRRTRP